MEPLSRSSVGTLYHQILSRLHERIESGDIGVGARLPSEADLERDYGVSRTTARRALDELRRQGLVRREPGRGTFLVGPRFSSDLARLYSFSDEIRRRGHEPGSRLVGREEIPASEEVASRLDIEPGERILLVRRLRLADGKPIFVGDSYLPIGRFPALGEADYGVVSLSNLFRETVGTGVYRARQWIGATSAPADVATLLELEEGAPVLQVKRVSCVLGDASVEYVEAFFHPGRYQHYNELSSGSDGIGH